jgi:hypothetical protein
VGRPPIPEASRRRLNETVERLRDLLPSEWEITVERRDRDGGTVHIGVSGEPTTAVTIATRERFEPRDVDRLVFPDGPFLVSAQWVSPRTRELLRELGAGFLDRTGNTELRLDGPALYLRTDGARHDPNPKRKQGPSLHGPRAWALLRTLAEVEPPYTVGELARACGVDDGYASRVLQVLVDELMIERHQRLPVTMVKWRALIEQVAGTYSLLGSNDTASWLAAGGPDQFLRDLRAANLKWWVLTGSFAANRMVSVTAPTIAVVYTDDPERLAKPTRLRPTVTGGNVITAVPYDPVVFRRTSTVDGLTYASVAQVAIDCLTGMGRMPQEGGALVDWMRRNVPRWRAATLEEPPRVR